MERLWKTTVKKLFHGSQAHQHLPRPPVSLGVGDLGELQPSKPVETSWNISRLLNQTCLEHSGVWTMKAWRLNQNIGPLAPSIVLARPKLPKILVLRSHWRLFWWFVPTKKIHNPPGQPPLTERGTYPYISHPSFGVRSPKLFSGLRSRDVSRQSSEKSAIILRCWVLLSASLRFNIKRWIQRKTWLLQQVIDIWIYTECVCGIALRSIEFNMLFLKFKMEYGKVKNDSIMCFQ